MENLKINVNDFVSFLLKENENVQKRIHIEQKDYEHLTNLKIQKLIYFIVKFFFN